MNVQFIHDLESKLNQDLPGEDVQNLMAPIGSEKYRLVPQDQSC